MGYFIYGGTDFRGARFICLVTDVTDVLYHRDSTRYNLAWIIVLYCIH
jgi:hypothetical protein